MRIVFNKRTGRFTLLSFFIIPVLSVLICAACVSTSVFSVSRACRAMDGLLDNGEIPSDGFLSDRMSQRTLTLFLENYSDSQLLGAAYLLQNQGDLENAVFLLKQIPVSSSSLSLMAGELLMDCLKEAEDWTGLASYAVVRLSSDGNDLLEDDSIRRLSEAVWKGELNREEFRPFYEKSLAGWAVLLSAESGELAGSDFMQFLLTEDLALIDEILQYRDVFSCETPGRAVSLESIPEARQLIKDGRYGEAEILLRDLWEDLSLEPSLPPDFLEDLRRVITRTGKESFWIPELQGWTARLPDNYHRVFLMASLFEGDGQWERAYGLYETAAGMGTSLQSRRARWYQLRLLIRQDPEEVPVFLNRYALSWGNTDYFDDLMDEYYSLLVRSRSWRGLKETLCVLGQTSLSGAVTQGRFLLDEAVALGLTGTSEPARGITPAGDLTGTGSDYYALIQDVSAWPGIESAFPQEAGLSSAETVVAEVYKILHQAGYPELSLSLWNRRKDPLDYTTVEGLCAYLYQQEEFYRLIQFSGYWYYKWPRSLSVNLLPWLYPMDRGLPVNLMSHEFELPEELIEGIIRRESAFHRTIESFAGAQGLMQIMPATARDLASRYRIPEWDLMNPNDNLRLGSLYLNWLIERPWTDNYAEVLAAYNGGGGNLRQWKRHYGALGNQLFIQSIPYSETRNYIRKVIVAAGAYRYLNTGTAPGEWVSLFFDPFPVM